MLENEDCTPDTGRGNTVMRQGDRLPIGSLPAGWPDLREGLNNTLECRPLSDTAAATVGAQLFDVDDRDVVVLDHEKSVTTELGKCA